MSAFLCGASQTASACRCSANSPFRWAESYTPGSSFAADWQKNATSAKASTQAVEDKRAQGIDPGFIGGLNTPMHHVRPSDKKAWAGQQVAKLLKPATFTVYSKAKPSGRKES
jgi:hypothetical protein